MSTPPPGEREAMADEWFRLVWDIGQRVGCLASSFPDGNAHILRAIDRLAAAPSQPVAAPELRVFDGPDSFASAAAFKARIAAEIEAAGGLEAWRASQPVEAPTKQDEAQTYSMDACDEAFVRDFCPYKGSPDPFVVWHAAWRAASMRAAQVCRDYAAERWDRYKNTPNDDNDRANPYVEGQSDGADHCASAIEADAGIKGDGK
jgi:hypothetical protein